MSTELKQLGQVFPETTEPVKVYSPERAVTGIVRSVIVCNVTDQEAKFSIFCDLNGETFDPSTALYYGVVLKPSETRELSNFIPMHRQSASFAVQSSVPKAINFTISGVEQKANEIRV